MFCQFHFVFNRNNYVSSAWDHISYCVQIITKKWAGTGHLRAISLWPVHDFKAIWWIDVKCMWLPPIYEFLPIYMDAWSFAYHPMKHCMQPVDFTTDDVTTYLLHPSPQHPITLNRFLIHWHCVYFMPASTQLPLPLPLPFHTMCSISIGSILNLWPVAKMKHPFFWSTGTARTIKRELCAKDQISYKLPLSLGGIWKMSSVML